MKTTSESSALMAQKCWRVYKAGCSAPSTVSAGQTSTNTKMYNEGMGVGPVPGTVAASGH